MSARLPGLATTKFSRPRQAEACRDRRGGLSPEYLTHWNPVGRSLNSRESSSRAFTPHRQPLSSVTPRPCEVSPRGDARPPSPQCSRKECLPYSLVHVIGPSGYLSCLAHMLCKILKAEPTLVGRMLKVELTCTNLRHDCVSRARRRCQEDPGILTHSE